MAGMDIRGHARHARTLASHLAKAMLVLLVVGTVAFVWIGAASTRAPAHGRRTVATVTAVSTTGGFRPSTVTIARGGTVRWRNADKMPHNVVSKGGGGISSPVLQAGQSYSKAFRQAGRFQYFCALHPDMRGTVVVR